MGPEIGEEVPADPPAFVWTPPPDAPEDAEYTLHLGEITGEQGDRERIRWRAFRASANAKSLTVGKGGDKLLGFLGGSDGREYFWYVEALDRSRGLRGVSEVRRFTRRR